MDPKQLVIDDASADPLSGLPKPIRKKSSRENHLEKELINEEKHILEDEKVIMEDNKDYSEDRSPLFKNKKTNQEAKFQQVVQVAEEPSKNPFLLYKNNNPNPGMPKNFESPPRPEKNLSDSQNLTPQSSGKRSSITLESLFPSDEILSGEILVVPIKCMITVAQYPTLSAKGHFVLTNFRIIFRPEDPSLFKKHSLKSDYLKIPLGFVSKYERSPDKKDPNIVYLEVFSKDGRTIKMRFLETQFTETALFKWLQTYTFPDQKELFFAFTYNKSLKSTEEQYKGWEIYDIEKEFKRQGVDFIPLSQTQDQTDSSKNPLFRIMSNKDFQICQTYPPLLLVPSKISDQAIIASSKFRTKERLPVVTYYYAKKGTFLSRSSQSKPGFYQSRCSADELLLRYLGNPSYDEMKDPEPKDVDLFIFDARPYLNAMANRVNGKGFEDTKWYKNCEIEFMDIDNIHKVRDAHKKLQNLCYSPESSNPKWLSQLESTGWLDIMSFILAASSKVARHLQEGKNCLVHCSDGWDRTAQMLSLAQIMLDSYFRTIEGFEVLVMKEWVYFGHQFNMRMGHGNRNEKDDQRSPVFIQFLDCVQQLLHQYPFAFEFNDTFLSHIAYHVYSCQFGTFLCNNYSEIAKMQLETKTTSLWSHLNSQKTEKYLNPFYNTVHGHENLVLRPSNHIKHLRLWEEYFLYYSWLSKPNYSLSSRLVFSKDFFEDIYVKQKDKIDLLKRENEEMKRKLNLNDSDYQKRRERRRFHPKVEESVKSDSTEGKSRAISEELVNLRNIKEEMKTKEIDAINLEGDNDQRKAKKEEEEEAVLWKEKHGHIDTEKKEINETEDKPNPESDMK